MIFDSLDRLSLYAKDFPALKTADAILKEDLLSKEPGSYTTDDPNCRYSIVHYETHVGHKDFEIHQREADLQIMLSGGEIMKAATRDLALQAQGYDANKDIAFVKGETMVSYTARPGFFALFLPGEPHAPGIALTDTAEKAKKVVFKIKV
ncbi:MAG: YhcH/YjgK/YiaL family protein [Spirochaetia bacterium]|nr:YhcH/YjgK/YiaL family protein [Spirochaetia bacterium]